MENSKIEWTHHTWNPWRGCTKVSPGCAHCYAEKFSHRNPGVLGVWGDNGTRVVANESAWREPLKWNRAAKAAGERHRVFCASLADVFEDRPELHGSRFRLFRLIQDTPNLDWLLLTKRPQNIIAAISHYRGFLANFVPPIAPDIVASRTWARDWIEDKPPANVWLGVSVEDQARADERIPELLKVPAAVRFLSVEPLLAPVDLRRYLPRRDDANAMFLEMAGHDPIHWGIRSKSNPGIDWAIVGGESGPKARPMHPDWARSIRDQCVGAGVPFFFKQWGEHRPMEFMDCVGKGLLYAVGPDGRKKTTRLYYGREDKHPGWVVMAKPGKKAAGRTLDGRTWDDLPKEAAPCASA